MESSSSRFTAVKQLVWLVLFIYALMIIFFLLFPPKAEAATGQDEQAQLLDGLLGRLEYTESGVFVPVADAALTTELMQLQAQYHLDTGQGSAWILDKQTGFAVWGTAHFPLKPAALGEADKHNLQFLLKADRRYAVQNFHLSAQDGSLLAFQMVVALPVN